MTTPTTAALTRWVGWFRPSEKAPWTAIVEADDETTAFNRLIDAARGGDFTVLPKGRNPNDKLIPARR